MKSPKHWRLLLASHSCLTYFIFLLQLGSPTWQHVCFVEKGRCNAVIHLYVLGVLLTCISGTFHMSPCETSTSMHFQQPQHHYVPICWPKKSLVFVKTKFICQNGNGASCIWKVSIKAVAAPLLFSLFWSLLHVHIVSF